MNSDSFNKKRIFVALPAVDAKNMILPVLRKLKTSADRKEWDLKWTPIKNLHLTLKFFGNLSEDEIESLIPKLAAIAKNTPPPVLKLRGLGGFPDETESRVLWMGVQNQVHLRKLQSEIHSISDFPSDSEAFQPHITLARLRNKRNIADLISPFVRKDFGKIQVPSMILFESHLQQNFPIYLPLKEFVFTHSE